MILRDQIICKAIVNNINNNSKIKKHFDFTYCTQKHKLKDIVEQIIDIIKYALPWRFIKTIPYGTVYKAYQKMIKFKVIKNTYIDLLRLYFKKGPNSKLRLQTSDTTCVRNRYGSELISFSGSKKFKCTKVSFICDSKKVPIHVDITNPNKNDTRVLREQLQKPFLLDNLDKKHNKYFLADKGYDSNLSRQQLREMNYMPIIGINKRDTKYKK